MLVHTPRGEAGPAAHRAEVLVPQGPRRRVSCGPFTARTPASARGFSAAVKARPRLARDADRAAASLGEEGIDTEGLGVTPEAIANLVEVDVEDWKPQLPQIREHQVKSDESRPSCTRRSRSWTSAYRPTEPGDRTHSARRTPERAQPLAPMTRSIVKLAADAGEDSEVYVNGVRSGPTATCTSTRVSPSSARVMPGSRLRAAVVARPLGHGHLPPRSTPPASR
jgi:hypothetical protein